MKRALALLSALACIVLLWPSSVQARDPNGIASAIDQWWDTNPGATGVVVRWKDQIVYEGYRDGQSADDLMPVYSITKSIGALLTGIAIHRGDLPGVDAPIAPYFPDYADQLALIEPPVTLFHLLTMTTGWEWGWHKEGRPIQAYRGDLDQAALTLPRATPPGEVAIYSTLIINLIAGLLEEATGRELEEYAKEVLFEPLGIATWEWHRDDTGRATIGAGLRLTTRDVARVGQFVIDRGRVDGKALLAEEYIATATSPLVQLGLPDGGSVGYGYLFWQSDGLELPHYIGFGYAEQMVFGVFEYDLVVAVSSPCCSARHGAAARLVTDFLLPVLQD